MRLIFFQVQAIEAVSVPGRLGARLFHQGKKQSLAILGVRFQVLAGSLHHDHLIQCRKIHHQSPGQHQDNHHQGKAQAQF